MSCACRVDWHAPVTAHSPVAQSLPLAGRAVGRHQGLGVASFAESALCPTRAESVSATVFEVAHLHKHKISRSKERSKQWPIELSRY